MKYKIQHSNISACIYVTDPLGNVHDCYYMSANRPVQLGVAGTEADAEARFMQLPMEVRAAVNKQFGQVFSLPLHRCGEWVANQMPFEVEVQEGMK